MKELLEMLKEFLPIPIFIGFAVFIYFLVVFKRIADEFLKISKAREQRAEKEVEFLEKRFSVVGSEVEVLEKITLAKTERIDHLIKEREELKKELESKENELAEIESNKAIEKKEALKKVSKQLSKQVKGLHQAYMVMDRDNMSRLPFVSLNLARQLSLSKDVAYYAKMDVFEFTKFVEEYGVEKSSEILRKYSLIVESSTKGTGFEVSRVGDGHFIFFSSGKEAASALFGLLETVRKDKYLQAFKYEFNLRVLLDASEIDDDSIEDLIDRARDINTLAVPGEVCITKEACNIARHEEWLSEYTVTQSSNVFLLERKSKNA